MSHTQAQLPIGEGFGEAEQSDHPPMPESPPTELLEYPLPPVAAREEIAPESDCGVRTGDLLVVHVGTDAIEWWGNLILATYGTNKLVGLALPNYQYVSRDLESWVEWSADYLSEDHIRVYDDVAPVAKPTGWE